MTDRSRTPRASALVALFVVMIGVAGCGRKDFTDRTARVTIDGVTNDYQVDSCGLDGQTVFVVGRTDSGRILQAVVGVRADGHTGVLASTGVSVTGVRGLQQSAPNAALIDDDGLELAAFGAESWERRQMSGAPPGEVESARVRGSRIQVSGSLQVVAPDKPGAPDTADAPDLPFALDARCDLK